MKARLTALVRRLRADAAAYLVLAIGVAAAAAVYLYVAGAVAAQERAHFDRLAQGAVEAIHDRMEAYVATLRAARGIFGDGREPSRAQFRDFVGSLELERYYPGIQGIGYAKLLAPDAVAAHERRIQAEGFPSYRVWPEGARPVYTAIDLLEPFDWRNQRAFGYDMMSEPVRRAAMERALDEGVAAATARVELVQESGAERQPGFLIYLPVFAGQGDDPATRRARTLGFVYAPFRAGNLLEAVLAAEQLDGIAVEVYDGEAVDPGARLFRMGPRDGPASGGLTRQDRLVVAGRPWTVRMAAAPGFVARWQRWLPRGVALVGALVALLVFRVTQQQARSREAAQRAAVRARFLADAGKALASSLDYRASLAEVACRAARDQADWCVVLLVEPEGPVRLVGHRDEAEARGAEADLEGLLLDPEERFGAAAALGRGEPFLAGEVDDATLRRIARSPAQIERLRRVGLRSVLTVPLRTRGEPLGAITLAWCEPGRRFDDADLAMALDLARLAVAAIDTSRSYRRAQEAVRLRDDFLSIASHELKTPLTSLALQADSLMAAATRGNAPPQMGRKAEVIRRNVDRLNRLIANLLDISRIGAGRLELDLEELDLGEIAREVLARFEDEAARVGCELRLDVRGPARGRWDRLRLDQVITNLVANAVKYGPGHPVTVTVRGDGDRAILAVRDHGIGIPREAQARIFERFERAVTERHYGGFGLGLWIVRRIVEALGGSIRVESEPGLGATFIVELHRSVADEERDVPAVGDAAAPGPGAA